MAPMRRFYYRHRRGRWLRSRGPGNMEPSMAGEVFRRIYDSYCPFCATDIRNLGNRRLGRCPNTSLCGKPLPLDDTCPSCSHYVRPNDNFCRICRSNLRNVVRGRGGLYQQINRVPSPLRTSSPPRPEPQADLSDEEEGNMNESEEDEEEGPGNNNGGGNGRPANANPNPGQGGFLRVVPLGD